jgi:hypothetical protein
MGRLSFTEYLHLLLTGREPTDDQRFGPRGAGGAPHLVRAISERLRATLVVQADVDLVPWGSLERSEYKSRLVLR